MKDEGILHGKGNLDTKHQQLAGTAVPPGELRAVRNNSLDLTLGKRRQLGLFLMT